MSQILIKSSDLLKKAAADEQTMVRLILRDVTNQRPYSKRGRRSTIYLFEFNPKLGAHVLDVPQSVWMKCVPTAGLKANESLAWDIMGSSGIAHSPIIPLVI